MLKKTQILISPYQLEQRFQWSRDHVGQGVLIQIRDEAGNQGFADLHPWITLGDLDINNQLSNLKTQKMTPLLARTMMFAQKDLNFRKINKKLIDETPIENHILILDNSVLKSEISLKQFLNTVDTDSHSLFNNKKNDNIQIQESSHFQLPLNKNANQNQNLTFKIKVGSNKNEDINLIEKVTSFEFVFRIRLDFNALFNFTEAVEFWQSLSPRARAKIQFIEDPIPWDYENWTALKDNHKIPLALDRAFDQKLNLLPTEENIWSQELLRVLSDDVAMPFDFFIYKPAVQDFKTNKVMQKSLKQKNIQIVVTSYLDHPVGILHAWSEAQEMKKLFPNQISLCGLNSFNVYNYPIGLDEALRKIKINNKVANDNCSLNNFGIGLDYFFKSLEWTPWEPS